MNYIDVLNSVRKYNPLNEAEACDKEQIIWLLENYKEKAFSRNLMFGHITASGIVVDETHEYMLMCFHNIYKSWAWLGGHADGEMDLEKLARREILEETGLDDLHLFQDSFSSMEVLSVDGHIKKGKYVPTHLHYNLTYLYVGDKSKKVFIKPDENSNVKWIKIKDLYDHVKNDHDMYHIYKKNLERIVCKDLFTID